VVVSAITQIDGSDRRRNRPAAERKERLNTSAGLHGKSHPSPNTAR
jgi:hypothetical protein